MEPKKYKKLETKINKLMRKGKLDVAIEHIRQELSKDTRNGLLYFMLGSIYRNDGQYRLAESAFRSAEELLPDNPGTKWELAEFLIGLDRPEEGLSYAEFSVKEWPSDSQPHAVLGNAYLKLKRYDEAEKSLQEAVRLSKWNPDARFWLVEVYEQTERFHLIQAALEQYLSDAPNLACSHVFMAEYLHHDKGDCVAAFPYYEKGLKITQSGKNSSWYKNYFTTTDYPLAIIDSYSQALIECDLFDAADAVARENFKKGELLAWRASLLSRMGDLEGAVVNISKSIKSHPNAPNWHYQLGAFHIKQGKYADAEHALRTMVDLSKNLGISDVWQLGALVVTLLRQEKNEEAKLVSDQALDRNAERLWASLAHHHHSARDWVSTIQAGQNALKNDERQDTTLKYMAEAYAHLKLYDQAVKAYERILDFQPRNGRIWRAMGEVYAQAGETKKAIEAMRHAIDDGMLSTVQEKEAEKFVAELKITQ